MATHRADDIRVIQTNQHDIASEKTMIEHLLDREGLREYLYPNSIAN